MAKRRVFHLVKKDELWVLKEEGSDEPILGRRTKAMALEEAVPRIRRLPGLTQLKIHLENGRFEEERTYGQDPERYEG